MTEIIDTKKEKCQYCDGCGKVANTDNREPWKYWEELPPGSDIAVKLGIVKSVDCANCLGTGYIYTPE